MPEKYQSVIQFLGIKVDSGQYSFHWALDQASFQVKFFVPSLIFYILSRKCSTERKFGTQALRYLYFQIHLLFLAAGLLQDKAREKGLVNVYIFQQPNALSKTGRFQNNSDKWKKRY